MQCTQDSGSTISDNEDLVEIFLAKFHGTDWSYPGSNGYEAPKTYHQVKALIKHLIDIHGFKPQKLKDMPVDVHFFHPMHSLLKGSCRIFGRCIPLFMRQVIRW